MAKPTAKMRPRLGFSPAAIGQNGRPDWKRKRRREREIAPGDEAGDAAAKGRVLVMVVCVVGSLVE